MGIATIFGRLLPRPVSNRFEGYRAALWLLGLYIALKLAMSINSIVNTAAVASGADGIPLDSFGPEAARTVLMLFALMSLGQLTLALVALTILIRYRAMIPFIYLMLLGEALARRLIVRGYEVARADGAAGWYVNVALLALLALGLGLSLVHRRRPKTPS